MSKIKSVLPSAREKKRYLVYEVISETRLPGHDIRESISRALSSFFGTFALSLANPAIGEARNNMGIIRVNHRFVDHLKVALMLIKDIQNMPVIIKTRAVSGILRKAKLHFK